MYMYILTYVTTFLILNINNIMHYLSNIRLLYYFWAECINWYKINNIFTEILC